jgi:hypothetical protein
MRNDRLQRPTACAPLTAVAAALCLSLPASPASADPSAREKASAILAEGAKLYERRDFAAALAHFQSAYALFPNPKIYFDFALAYAGMGKPAQALIALERFLAEARDASPAHTREAREQVKRLSKKVAFVTVKGGADGAEAFLDGTLIGKTPLPARLPVDVGRHAVVMRGSTLGSWSRTFTVVAGQSLELPLGGLVKAGDGYAEVVVSAPGYSPIRHSLSLQPGLTRQFFVTLERQSSSGTPSQASRLIVSQAIRTTNQDPPAGNGRLRTAGLVTGAAGIAALGYGLFQTYRVHALSTGVTSADRTGVARGRSAERQQWWAYGLGAAALGTGGLLYWLGQSAGHSSAPAVSLAAVARPNSFFVALHLRQ